MANEYTPTVDEVGAFLHARTPNRYGDDQGTFNADTTPNKEQVESMIQDAVDEVAGQLTDLDQDEDTYKCLPRLRRSAKVSVIIYTGMLIELGYFPEQTTGQYSPYDRLEKLFDKKLKALIEGVSECIGGGDDESIEEPGGITSGMPSGNFEGLDGVGERQY